MSDGRATDRPVGDGIIVTPVSLVCGVRDGGRPHNVALGVVDVDGGVTVHPAGGAVRMDLNGSPHFVATCPKHGTVGVSTDTILAAYRRRLGRKGRKPLAVPMATPMPRMIKVRGLR